MTAKKLTDFAMWTFIIGTTVGSVGQRAHDQWGVPFWWAVAAGAAVYVAARLVVGWCARRSVRRLAPSATALAAAKRARREAANWEDFAKEWKAQAMASQSDRNAALAEVERLRAELARRDAAVPQVAGWVRVLPEQGGELLIDETSATVVEPASTSALTKEPGRDVRHVWDKDGDRWDRLADGWAMADDGGGPGGVRRWEYLVRSYGPIRATPAGGGS